MRKFFVSAVLLLSLQAASTTDTTIRPPAMPAAKFPLTVYDVSEGRMTPTYDQIINWWKQMDAASPMVKMMEMGPTDAGLPLHLVLVSTDKDFDITSVRKKKKTILFVLNGIHPGEPDGIDATMQLVREIVFPNTSTQKKPVDKRNTLPSNVVLAIIPVYNIGGALNRSPFYRVDQNGPEEFGSRGNSQNLDLNRDFIKCDSREALSFSKVFRMLDPDVFVDNHVSNGADYQHVITLLTTQHNKLGGKPGTYLDQVLEPAIYDSMKARGWDLVPYVNHFGETPEKGWPQFWDSPRYSSGYAALWNTFAFVPETHMLKPYPQRVAATKDLMYCFIKFLSSHADEILALRKEAKEAVKNNERFPIAWKFEKEKSSPILFKGYASGKKTSEVSGLQRLYYDRSRPYEKTIPFFKFYSDTLSVKKPMAYIIPQGWNKVIERLKANGIIMKQLQNDTTIEVEWYRIESYQSLQRPFEGHHLNTQVKVSSNMGSLQFRKGDWYIPMNQEGNRFLIEVLEPQAEDSYFAWNFFDGVLGQKEGFSDYVFEETAAAYLREHPEIRKKLEEKKAADPNFAQNARAQLSFVYQNSPYMERGYLRYPVYRVIQKQDSK